MRISGKILAAVLLIFVIFTAPSTADIISVKVRSHNRAMILFSKFEFSHTGYVSVAVSSVGTSSIPVTSNSSQPDPSRIGFFLLSDELSYRYDREFIRNPDLCALDIKFVTVVFTFRDLSPPPHSFLNKSYHVIYPGEYSVYFANCNDLSLVTMDVRTELYNIHDDGTTKDYLSAGQTEPSVYLTFSLTYLYFLWFWVYISLKNQQCFQRIHLLMGVLLVMTVAHFLCAVGDQHDLKVTGIHSHQWRVLLYVFQFLRNVLFFVVIWLIGAGWSLWKPFLRGREIFILTTLILLQVWANVRSIGIGESGPYNEEWLDMIDEFTFIDFICCVVVFVYTLWSAKAFNEATDTSTTFDEATGAAQLWCAGRPGVFTLSILLYVFYSRGLNIPTVALETGNLVFTMLMFLMYGPFFPVDEDEKRVGFLDQVV